jgi:hypothetical protein
MSESDPPPSRKETVSVVRGQLHKFMLIPIMEHHVKWFPAGPVTFGVEGRVLGDAEGNVGERGSSIHIFNPERTEEYARFDCFSKVPHYHYILNADQHNILWGYDPEMNGPMLPWALGVIRARLPSILRNAGESELADRVEGDGWDTAVLDQVEAAMIEAWDRTFPGTDMVEEGRAWYDRWKRIHPQFNTVD